MAQQVTLSTSNLLAYVGTVLQGSYHYVDADGDGEGGTDTVWLRDGQPIQGANQDIYTVTALDSGKNLQYRVTPVAATGKSPGVAVVSLACMIKNSPPTLTGLAIFGVAASDVYSGQELSPQSLFKIFFFSSEQQSEEG